MAGHEEFGEWGQETNIEVTHKVVTDDGNELSRVVSHQVDGDHVSYKLHVPQSRATEFSPAVQQFLFGKIISDERGQTS